jgi:hypothetical protein
VSYFRPENAREIAPRSACSLPNSTQKVSRKRGRVKTASVPIENCLTRGVQSADLSPN